MYRGGETRLGTAFSGPFTLPCLKGRNLEYGPNSMTSFKAVTSFESLEGAGRTAINISMEQWQSAMTAEIPQRRSSPHAKGSPPAEGLDASFMSSKAVSFARSGRLRKRTNSFELCMFPPVTPRLSIVVSP